MDFNDSLLPTNQRRLRHLRSIIGRELRGSASTTPSTANLSTNIIASPISLPNCFFSIHVPLSSLHENYKSVEDFSGESEITLYTSETILCSSNPNWKSIPLFGKTFQDFSEVNSENSTKWTNSELITDLLSTRIFSVRIWETSPSSFEQNKDSSENHKLLFHITIDLRSLTFVGSELKKASNFISNTIVLQLIDGFYISNSKQMLSSSKSSLNSSISRNAFISKMNKPGISLNSNEFLKIVHGYWRLKGIHVQTQQLINSISSSIQSMQFLSSKKEKVETSKIRIERLKNLLSSKLNSLQLERDDEKRKKEELLPRIRTVSKANVSLLASKQFLSDDIFSLSQSKRMLANIHKEIVRQKWKLIRQLKRVYSITQSTPIPKSKITDSFLHSNSNSTSKDVQQKQQGSFAKDASPLAINGISLPNSDFTGCDEEQIATALGYVAHLVLMIAKYLEVPLRYPMLPMCSRSIVRDDISHQISPKFPLYSRGVDRTRFEYGVFLLNKNIEQLMNNLGIDSISLRHTLPNLHLVLNYGPRTSMHGFKSKLMTK